MMWSLLLCICAVAAKAVTENVGYKIVYTSQGPVRGHKNPSTGVFEFYGIPYATAPTGPDKFKAPLAPPTWEDPLDAIDKGVICPQSVGAFNTNNIVQEDCLVANIFIPDTEVDNLPVVVDVHSGGFEMGSGSGALQILAAAKKVVGVSFNYRLGIHGFLCLGTVGAPGNAGMKDQVALLRWVQKNIRSFGGNPEEVTISGCSAGSASVDLLMLSPMTKGLFNKVIACSGSNVGPFAIHQDPIGMAKEHALRRNFTNIDDIYALQDFYTTTPISSLLLDFTDRKDSALDFSPCLEHELDSEVFLNEAPVTILKQGNYRKVPLLYGFTNMEGLMRSQDFDEWKDMMNEKFSDFLPAGLKFESEEEKEFVANMIKEFYFGDEPVSATSILSYIKYYTDVLIAYPMLKSVQLHVEAGNDQVYLFEYSFVDNDTSYVPYTNVRGANHCAQNAAVFERKDLEEMNVYTISEEYTKIKTIMRDFWYNFITTGQPVPEWSSLPAWPAVGDRRSPHMSVGTEVKLLGSLLPERAQFWDKIYAQYYQPPFLAPL